MNIDVIGKDERMKLAADILHERAGGGGGGRLILLPIPSTRDGVYITSSDILVSDFIATVSPGDTVVGYALSSDFSSGIYLQGGLTIDISEDEDYVLRGADLTAAGVLHYILGGEASPSDLSIGIMGYGRIGKRLCEILSPLGAKLWLFSRRADIDNPAVTTKPYSKMSECLASLDLLINTAPARILKDSDAKLLSESCRVLEIASGDNIPSGISAVRLMSLPAKKFPISAALAVVEAVEKKL